MTQDTKPGTILTLDAGGTTFAFSHINRNKDVSDPFVVPSQISKLSDCIDCIIAGFERCIKSAQEPVSAISFAFPGPADYPNGVIGDLGNLPVFRGGVPLGPILSNHFNVPVYINNDGNLFALGEADSGFLMEINSELEHQHRSFQNLIGVTLGTGLGCGIVINGQLLIGDTSSAGELWLVRHKGSKDLNAEEGVSIRAIKHRYSQLTDMPLEDVPEPEQLCSIADGSSPGDQQAAKDSFNYFGEVLGDALANVLTLVDGAIVMGGGLNGASKHFMSAVMKELNGEINGRPRLVSKVFDLDIPNVRDSFYEKSTTKVTHPKLDSTVPYVHPKKIPIGMSRLGTSRSVAIGAFRYAMNRLQKSSTQV